ncbi:MAG: resuscitation-promoting factor RpfE, partial [Mycobacterium sp.]
MKNVRQTLSTAAITGVLAAAPLTLSNAIASADYERFNPSIPAAEFAPAGFVPPAPAADAPSTPDVAPAADATPAPADLPPAPDA